MGLFFAKMERKYGKYAIRNLPLYLAIIYGFGFILNMLFPQTMDLFTLNFHAIFKGQVWRLLTWILVPEGMNIFFTLISLYLYYSLGRTLERTWGSFLFNVYFFSGVILTVLGALILFGFLEIFGQEWIAQMNSVYTAYLGEVCPDIYGGSYGYLYVAEHFGIFYINMSIFLAFAMTYPDMQVYVFFFLPIKVKVLGIIYVIILGITILMPFAGGNIIGGVINLVSIGMSLMNTFLFFLIFKTKRVKSPKEIKRQHDYKVKVKAASTVTRHKCAICGQTEKDNQNLSFRYCSKCEGNYEYCSEHLFTHEHVKKN